MRKVLFIFVRWLLSQTIKKHLVSVVLKAECSSPDSAPHFLPQISRINVLKSNFRVKLPGWKNNRRRLVASQGIMRLAQGLFQWLVFVLVNHIFFSSWRESFSTNVNLLVWFKALDSWKHILLDQNTSRYEKIFIKNIFAKTAINKQRK